MTYYTTNSTTGSWTYNWNPSPYQSSVSRIWSTSSTTTNDCSGLVRSAVKAAGDAERSRKNKEAELQKAFDEVFDGQ